MTGHPEFLEAKTWIPGPDPPDVILTDIHGRQVGIELTEWLDERQATPSIADRDNEMRWLTGLDTEHSPDRLAVDINSAFPRDIILLHTMFSRTHCEAFHECQIY